MSSDELGEERGDLFHSPPQLPPPAGGPAARRWLPALVIVAVLAATTTTLVVRSRGNDAASVSGTTERAGAGTTTTAPQKPPPNVMVIMVDDATYEELRVMQNVNALLVAQGTVFNRYYVTTPNCCPSRAGYYTGQYPHNNGVKDNEPPLGGAMAFVPHQNDSLAVWMQKAGYYTAHVGKYLNGWGDPTKPNKWTGGIVAQPGWDRWFGLIDPYTYSYFNYRVSVDGVQKNYGSAEADYQTDVLGQEVIDTMTTATQTHKPWFISFTPPAPHIGVAEGSPATQGEQRLDNFFTIPAPRHKGTFSHEPLYSVPSQQFDLGVSTNPDLSSKPPYVQKRVKKEPAAEDLMTASYQAELEALQAVDEWVGKIHQKLIDLHQLANTLIVYTSDNGLFHGEHGLAQKGLLYEEAVHTPLVIRGPGFPAGGRADQLVQNLDLAPTILKAARATATVPIDGRDLQPVAQDPKAAANRAILLEMWYSLTKITTQEIRVDNWAYARWSTGEQELYDLSTDPYEITNLASEPKFAQVIAGLSPRMDALATCAGATCEDSDASRAPR